MRLTIERALPTLPYGTRDDFGHLISGRTYAYGERGKRGPGLLKINSSPGGDFSMSFFTQIALCDWTWVMRFTLCLDLERLTIETAESAGS